MMMILRQGDVLLRQIAQLPNSAEPASNTLAEGELTGHHHIAYGCETVCDEWGDKFVSVTENNANAVLRHQDVFNAHEWTGDHHDIQIPPGVYAVILQRQYDPKNPSHNPLTKD